MNSNSFFGRLVRRICWSLLFFPLLMSAQEGRQFPLGPIGGYYSVTGNSSLAIVRSVDAGGAGATAGLQAGDYIYGAFGQTFTPTGGDHYGVTQELGFAVDRAEAGNGTLPLMVMRPGTGGITINVPLAAAGAFGPAYPRNSAKYAPMYEAAVADLHTRAMNSNGNLGYPTGFAGLCLLGHPNWNDTTGPKPYRLSINKIRDFAVYMINAWGYAPTEYALVDGSVVPNPMGGPDNWTLGQHMMFLSEYYAKTSDSSVFAALQRGAEMSANTVQWWKQPSETGVGGFQPEYNQVAGMSSHGGVTGDYMHQGWYCGINATGVHNMNGLAFARRAGVNMEARPKDGHYFGFTVNPGDPIPAGVANALPSSITLPQYAADPVRGLVIQNTSSPLNRSDASDPFFYNPSLSQKFLMQMNLICRRSLANGSVRYAPETGDDPDSLRTTGALLAMSLYQNDVGGMDSADLDRLESMKNRITYNYMAQQTSHVVCLFSGQAFQSICTPFLSDRQQRFSLDNWRFYYALSRTANNGYRYFQARGGDDAGAYQDNGLCASINIALPYGIANGGYSLIPAYNTNRSIATFKSPFLMWPSLAARTCTVTSSTQAFQVDVCDGNGNVLAPGSYTATWSNVSGPATATFSPNDTASTTIGLPTVSTTPYRVRLTISRSGVPNLVEDIDITRANATTPVPASIASQPSNQITAPGGSASFNVTMAGTGPFIYQWRLNGVACWTASPNSTLSLTNLAQGAVGSYDCVITTPTGTIVSNSATLTINSPLVRTSGGLRREIWNAVYGYAISDLTSNINFPSFPTITNSVSAAEAPLHYTDNFGEKLSGWVKPPISGAYKFFVTGDDTAQIWLSTDATAANKVKIADLTTMIPYRAYSSGAQSAAINLVAGQKYYIEILHKEAGEGDHVSVAWQMPGEPAPANGSEPIPGVYLEFDQYQPLLTNHWKFDEASGSTGADSVGTATATLYNNPTRVAGISGNAISLNGVNQYAQATVDVSESVYAVSLWFKTTQASGGLFSVMDGSSHDRDLYLEGGNLKTYIWQGGETLISTGQNYADGQWHHVVHTFGGAIGGQKLYVDGVQVASGGKANSDFNWQTAVRIGHAPNSTFFNGQIDDVRVYNSGLGVSDGALIYAAASNAQPQMSPQTFVISEGSSVGATVGTMTSTDANAGQAITYSIIGGNIGNRFAIHPSTGAITLAAMLDYEWSATHVLTITATDNGTPAQSVTATATINVTNVNEPPYFASSPVVGNPAAPGLAYSSSITGTDPENAGPVTYAKLSGPSWLSISSNGALTGTPATGNIGQNLFTVRATDSTSQFVDVTLRIHVIDVAVDPVWTNPSGGSWPVAANWLSNGVANGQSATANFASLDLTASATVNLDGARTIGGLRFGDTTQSHDWTLDSGSGGALTLAVPSGSPVITVENQTTTISAILAGTQGLYKTGFGTLALTQNNSLSGAVTISQGAVRMSTSSSLGSGAITLGDANTGAANIAWWFPGGGAPSNAVTVSNQGSGTVTIGTWSAPFASPSCPLTLNRPTTLHDSTGDRTTFFGKISGTVGTLTLSGPRITFANSTNDFIGNMVVSNGTVYQNDAGGSVPDATVVTLQGANSYFRLNSNSETIGGLNGIGIVDNVTGSGNTLTVGGGNGSGTFTGTLSNGSGVLNVTKIGSGTQTLGGFSNHSGTTTINGGTLQITGTLGASSAVTVNSGATLAGTGVVNGTVTLNSGAILSAGTASPGVLTLSNSVSLHDSGTVALRVFKSGGIVGSDRISLTGTTGIVYKGALTVTTVPGGESLAAGDSFTLFTKTSGTFSGTFAPITLPGLPSDLRWDTSRLTIDGVIKVETLPLAGSPVFSLAAGTYVGPKTVDISSATTGASIRYTTDGTDPKSSGSAITGASPVSISIPAPASVTLRAYAFASGCLDSATASASYETITSGSTIWTNTAGGSWPTAGNWYGGTVANGANVVARIDTLDLTADASITLDGARTIGGIKFADSAPSHNWTLNTGSSGPLTLAVTSGSPAITVANQTATLNAVLAGNQGLVKSGAGTLALGATNTLTGNVVVSQGRLALNSNTALPATANVVIGDANSGATAPNLYIGGQLTPTFATLSVGSGVAGAKLHTSGWAPTVNGVITLNSPLTIQQYDAGYVHTGIQTVDKITGPGAGAGNNTLIFSYGGLQNFYWHAINTAANDFAGNIRVTGAPGTMNAQGGANAANNVLIPDPAMVSIDSGCVFRWNNFGNSAVVETFDGLAGSGDMNRNLSAGLISSLSLTINASNSANEGQRNFTGVLSSLDSFTFTGTGTQIFGGANTYTCPTAINGGTLLVNGSLANTATTVAAAGTLGGTGTIAGAVTNNGTLAPGSGGVGNLTVNNTLTLANSSTLNWQISNWTGTAGTGWDKLTATSINITATSTNPIVIRPADLSLANFTESNATFVIAQTASGITGFSANKFTVNTTGLTLPQGTWAVQQSGNNLVLAYTRIPNRAPAFTSDPFNSNGTEDNAFSGTLAATDPDAGETLAYSKVSGPAWLTVATNGALSGTPSNSNVGANNFVVRVTDGSGATDDAALNITVANVNDAPVFTANPVSKPAATETLAYSGTLADSVSDADAGDTLTYSKVSGPAWLNVASNGSLSGTPATSDIGANTFSVRVTDAGGLFAEATLNITVNAYVSTGTWINPAGGSWPATGNWQSGTIASGVNATANFNTLNLTADATVTLDGARTIGNLNFGDITPSNSWTLGAGSGGPLTLSVSSGSPVISVANQSATISAVVAGTRGLVKSGNGTLTLTALNTYTGGTAVNTGELALKVPSDADWTMPGGAATIASGATLKLDLTAQSTQYRKSTLGAITFNPNSVLNLHGTVDNINSHYLIQAWGAATGAGIIRLAGGGSIAVWTNTNPLSGFTGQLDIQNGRFVSNVSSGSTLGGSFDVAMAAAGKLDLRSGHFTVDALDGVAGSQVHKSWTGDTINFTIGSGNGSGNFAGVMNGTNYNLVKTGTGTQSLSGTNTYTGTTSVNGGTLLVNGSLANTATTVAAAGTLGGAGTLAGAVTNNGTLAPGNAAAGNLTVNNTVTLANSSSVGLEFSDWAGVAGTGWDKLTATSLNITATSGSPVTLRLSETALANFTEASTSFVIAQTTAGITGFNADKFVIDASSLTTPQGTWAIQQSGNNLVLAYTRYNTTPSFTADPILAGATEDLATGGSISANDPDLGETLVYSKVTGPAWLAIASNGALSGTPVNGDVGVNNFSVRVTDSFGAEDTATLQITVANTNDAPGFISNPINGSAAAEDSAYSASIAGSATDMDAGDTLTYSKVSGPAWLNVSANGALSGTPANSNVGLNAFTVRVTDGSGAFANATLNISVTNTNDAPTFTSNPITGVAATEDSAYSASIAGSASDADAGDTLTFSKVSGPAWLSVASNGALSGTPTNTEVGANSFTVRVTDGSGAFTNATLNISVNNVNDAPVFTVDPILKADGTVGSAYTGQTLAGSATDVDPGDTVTYTKISGPAWLSVASDGALSGTPPTGSTGLNSFIVRVTDSASATDDAELRINVQGLPLPWTNSDIGTGMLAGSTSHNSGIFTGAGSGALGGTTDKLQFAYQTLTGDGEIIARISSLQNTGTSSRVGVMIRDTLAANSKQIFMGLTSSGSYRWVRRSTTGGTATTTNSSTGTVPNTWVRLVRSGTTITAYKSANGTSWTLVGSTTVTMAANCYIGLAVSSGSNTTLNTSQFGNVSVTP